MASVIKFRFNFAPAVGEIISLDVFGWHLQVISILYVGGPGASCPVNTTKRSKAVTGWKPTVSQHTHTAAFIFNHFQFNQKQLVFVDIFQNPWRSLSHLGNRNSSRIIRSSFSYLAVGHSRATLVFFFMDIGQVSLRTEHNFGYVTSVYVALVGQARVHSLITYPVQTQAYVTYIWMFAHLTIHRRSERAYSNIRTHYR